MNRQVPDDLPLLKTMMADLDQASHLYKPTNYWAHYQQSFLPELKLFGLRDFRSRKGSILSSFGATDNFIEARVALKWHFRGAGYITKVLNLLFKKLSFIFLEVTEIAPKDVTPYFYNHVKNKFKNTPFEMSQCPTSAVGTPEDCHEIDGHLWSTAHLQYSCMFVDASKRIPFADNVTVCELGTGMGRNIEIMARLLKNATFFVFDIPPQLYVCNQYLQALFGDRVITYKEGLLLNSTSDGGIPPAMKGKIIIQPTWRMPVWSKTKIDVFWNSASFQEMEPSVVLNYLNLVTGMNPEWIYINARPDGEYWGEWKPGRGGTKEAVVEKHYLNIQTMGYDLQESYVTDIFMRRNKYKSYVFKKRGSPK